MSRTYKKEILGFIKDIKQDIGEAALSGLFDGTEKASGAKGIGCGQFRELAMDCRVAECYDEMLLLIRYNQAKVSREKTSWKTVCANGKTFGDIIADHMEKVRALCGENAEWDDMREPMQLFFGYLYWQSRVWADEYAGAPTYQGGSSSFKNSGGKGQGAGYKNAQSHGRRQ